MESARPLTDHERDRLAAELARDGFTVLPGRLPEAQRLATIAAIDRIAAAERGRRGDVGAVKVHDCVRRDRVLADLILHEPALQLVHDAFGPMFHLAQSNCISRPTGGGDDFIAASPWHADGPRPATFPRVDDRVGLHYLKFGIFLTDLTAGDGGALQVVRGSHLRPELDGLGPAFRIADHARDVISFDVAPGTIVAFHQALWHAAPANRSARERKNVYLSYCPTWMRPIDREFPDAAELADLPAEMRWLLGEPRPAMRWWLPQGEDLVRMRRFARAGAPLAGVLAYD